MRSQKPFASRPAQSGLPPAPPALLEVGRGSSDVPRLGTAAVISPAAALLPVPAAAAELGCAAAAVVSASALCPGTPVTAWLLAAAGGLEV